MDQYKLVTIIRNHPQVWDRNNELFNKKDLKENAWKNIGTLMGTTADACKDAFKSLREKYIRERDKAQNKQGNYKAWDLLKELTFLDPHIIERQKYASLNIYSQESSFSKGYLDMSSSDSLPTTPTTFDKKLISLVYETESIWNRNGNMYIMNRQVKNNLWQKIGDKMNKPAHFCMLRWKSLREKYIRQKNKHYLEGEQKWEHLDDLKFLDKVILYRRKNSDLTSKDHHGDSSNSKESDLNYYYSGSEDNSLNESSSDFVVKEENSLTPDSSFSQQIQQESNFHQINQPERPDKISCLQKADSSFNSSENSRKRTNSETSEPVSKKPHQETEEKTPERLFGDLVVSLLMKKPEAARSMAMIEIMQILTK